MQYGVRTGGVTCGRFRPPLLLQWEFPCQWFGMFCHECCVGAHVPQELDDANGRGLQYGRGVWWREKAKSMKADSWVGEEAAPRSASLLHTERFLVSTMQWQRLYCGCWLTLQAQGSVMFCCGPLGHMRAVCMPLQHGICAARM